MNESAAHPVAVTDGDFADQVLKSDTPVLVDFWAEWCGPCKQIGPALEEISDELAGKVKIVKVNVDDNKQIAGAMGIRSIPTLAIYSGGEVKELVVGARPKDELVALLDKMLGS